MKTIRPHADLKRLLASVENPARYTGGEWGRLVRPDADYRVALCFPDLYEIGMSNQALAILYRLLNSLPAVAAERVFAPDLDFEAQLSAHGVPLYTLESGTAVCDCDMLAITVGYELAATSILCVLERGLVPLCSGERTHGHPLVVGGGPALSNPRPLQDFFDAVYIGEAEAGFPAMVSELRDMKRRGACRADMLSWLRAAPQVWHAGKTGIARRAVWSGFSSQPMPAIGYPVPSIRVIQDHGSVEIMRGCPNGCRFCHAGFSYRPFRMKDPTHIMAETDRLVNECGYREISLSSLSSGDYEGLDPLIDRLCRRYAGRAVSFSLPSLRINSFALDLLERVSAVRRSGLTFAVETPAAVNQRGLNKAVDMGRVEAILNEAAERGWKQAKFYFMIGLPLAEPDEDEGTAIVDFLRELRSKCRLHLSVNIGIFVPKPHTPLQWAAQIGEERSRTTIESIRRSLPSRLFKTGYHEPFKSTLEGLISRGDERVGGLILKAYRGGARLDSWEEKSNNDAWRLALGEADWNALSILDERQPTDRLPWDCIDLGVSQAFLRREYGRAKRGELSSACGASCEQPCGVCGQDIRPTAAEEVLPAAAPDSGAVLNSESGSTDSRDRDGLAPEPAKDAGSSVLLFSFRKTGPAAYLPHLGLMQVFERAFQRAGIACAFTEGFNPKPRLEFAQPLPLGVESLDELAAVRVHSLARTFPGALNAMLPEGLELVSYRLAGERTSLMSLYRGARFKVSLPAHWEAEPPAQGELTVLDTLFDAETRRRIMVIETYSPQGQPRGIVKALCAWLGEDVRREAEIVKELSFASGKKPLREALGL